MDVKRVQWGGVGTARAGTAEAGCKEEKEEPQAQGGRRGRRLDDATP